MADIAGIVAAVGSVVAAVRVLVIAALGTYKLTTEIGESLTRKNDDS